MNARGHRGRREDAPRSSSAERHRAPDDARRTRCASPHRSKVESMNAPALLTLPVARATSAVEHVEDAAEDDQQAGDEPGLGARERSAAMQAIPKPIRVRPLGVRPSRARPRPMGSARPRTRVRRSGETNEPLTRRPARRRAGRRGRGRAPGASANTSNASGTMVWTVSRPWRRADDEADLAQLARGATRRAAATGPTCSISSVTVAGPSARTRQIRSRFTSARTLWNRRSSRRSSG